MGRNRQTEIIYLTTSTYAKNHWITAHGLSLGVVESEINVIEIRLLRKLVSSLITKIYLYHT